MRLQKGKANLNNAIRGVNMSGVGFSEMFSDDTKRGFKIPQSEYLTEGDFPIIDQGDNIIAGFSIAREGLYTDVPVVVFGDHTRIVKYVSKPFFIGADGVKILKVQLGVFPRYAYYALKGARIQSLGYSRHFKLIKKLTFNCPTFEEQKRIAAELDQICELEKNLKDRLGILDQLVKSKFMESFGDLQTNPLGWPVGHVSDAGDYWNGLTYKPADVSDKGIIVLRSSNIQNGEIDLADLVRVNVKAKEKNYVQAGDILMCSRNGSAALVGKTAIIPPLSEKMYFGAFMMIIRAECPEYLNAFFKTKAFRAQIACGKTATVNQITCSMMDKVRVPLPPLPLQRKFAKFVAEVEKLKANLRETAATLDQIYRAKQQEYFG